MFKRLTAAAVGAGLMYYYDPELGRRRRSLLRDKCNWLANQSRSELNKSLRDTQHRVQGIAAELRSLATDAPVSDEVLSERVRSKMGRHVSHPGAIKVESRDGQVTLSGPILADEVERLVATVRKMQGVQAVDNQLEVHKEPGNISALQGEGRAPGERCDFAEGRWAPSTRLLATVGGGTLAAYTLARLSPGTLILGALGSGLCAALLNDGEVPSEIGRAVRGEQSQRQHSQPTDSQPHSQSKSPKRSETESPPTSGQQAARTR